MISAISSGENRFGKRRGNLKLNWPISIISNCEEASDGGHFSYPFRLNSPFGYFRKKASR